MSNDFTDFSTEEIKNMANEIHKREPKYGMAYAYRAAMLFLLKNKGSIYTTNGGDTDDSDSDDE